MCYYHLCFYYFTEVNVKDNSSLTFLSNFFSRLLTCFTFTAFFRMTGLNGGSSSSSLAHAWVRGEQPLNIQFLIQCLCRCTYATISCQLPCCLQVPLTCTSGTALSHCRSRQSTVSFCGGNFPSFPAKRIPHPSHAAFSVQKQKGTGCTFSDMATRECLINKSEIRER